MNANKQTTIVWIAELFSNEAAGQIGLMIEQGIAITKATLDRLAGN